MAFDADTHTALDASAARSALNAAIIEAQRAFSAVSAAARACEQLRRTAYDAPEYADICRIRDNLGRVSKGWPLSLSALETDLQREQSAACSVATMSRLTALYERGELSTIGD